MSSNVSQSGKNKKIIGVINQKGGVGKTTTATNLAVGFAIENKEQVLLLDADGQGNASVALGLRLDFEKETPLSKILETFNLLPFSEVLSNLKKTGNFIKPESFIVQTTAENVFLIPSDKALPLFLRGQPSFLLRTFLEELPVQFDRIIIDCPPSQNEIHNQVLESVDLTIVPCELTEFSVDGVNDVIEEFKHAIQFRMKRENLDFESFFKLLFVKVDGRRKRSPNRAKAQLENLSHHLFETYTRIDDRLNQAQGEGASIFHFAPHSTGAEDYRKLTLEILQYEQTSAKTAF